MRYFYFPVTLLVMLLAIGTHAQTPGAPPPPPPVAEYNSANWKEFTSAEGGFTVLMPGVPAVSSEPVDTEVGRIVMHVYVLTTKLGEYGVSYSDLPVRSNDAVTARKVLDGSRVEILANGAKRLNENDVTVDGILGRELIIEKGGVVGRHRMFLVNGRLYALIFAAAPNVAFKNGTPSSDPNEHTDLFETASARFFGSFKFTKRNIGASLPEQTQAPNDGILEPVAVKKDLYPSDADAKKEIEEALKLAVADKKRVLLVFGGNWCYDCHLLDRALHEGAAAQIMVKSFLLVHVNIGEGDKNLDLVKKYQSTLDKGVPAVVVLGSDGRVLYSSTEGEFEAARRMMKKDLVAFLLHWMEPKPASKKAQPGLRAVIDASRDGGAWWFPQPAPNFDQTKPHQGTALADYLQKRGWAVTEIPRGQKLTDQLKNASIVVRMNAFGKYDESEVAAYQEFVRNGGRVLLIEAYVRPGESENDLVARRFGVRFEGEVSTSAFRGASAATSDFNDAIFDMGSIPVKFPASTRPLAYLEDGRLVMGTFRYGRGKVVFLSSVFPILHVPQPFAKRLFDELASPHSKRKRN